MNNVSDTSYFYYPQNDAAGGGLGDSNYRLKTIQHGTAGTGNAWPDFTYEYDKVGNITKMITVSSDGTDTQTFTYDDWNRLISASAAGVSPTYSDSYTYNEIGNIDSYDGLTYSYSSSHKHAVASANGVTYSYDANGNMTLRNASGTVNDYSQNFNVENELSSVVNNGSTTSFAYDASGIRTKTVAANGTVTDFPFPGYEVENATGTQTVRLTFSIAGQAVALKVMTGTNPTYYLYNDHLGSTAKMSTTAGGTVNNSTARFYPFGDWRTEPTAGLTDMGFTGHRHNNLGSAPDDIGLIYMNARWYLPGLARFISADTLVPNPANPQSYNRYSYVQNSPVNLIDPSGHCAGGTTNNPFNDAGEIIYFDCTFDDFESLAIADRLRWIQQMMSQGMGGKLENWFNNIMGIIQSYQDFDLAHSGSWLSNVNAGILQGIQDGYALWSGTAYYSSLNPGGEAWKVFFTELGGFNPNEADLIKLWGVAEETSTNFGVGMATYKNILPNVPEAWFLGISKVYRLANAQFGGNLAPVGAFVGAVIDGWAGTDNGQMAMSLAVEQFADPRTLWGPNNDIAPVRYFADYFVWEPFLEPAE